MIGHWPKHCSPSVVPTRQIHPKEIKINKKKLGQYINNTHKLQTKHKDLQHQGLGYTDLHCCELLFQVKPSLGCHKPVETKTTQIHCIFLYSLCFLVASTDILSKS